MDPNMFFFGLAAVIGAIAKLIILLSCIVLLVKKRSLATWLMLAGSLIYVLYGLGSALGGIIIGRTGGPKDLIRFQWILQITGGFALFLFGFGFLIWVLGITRNAGVQQDSIV